MRALWVRRDGILVGLAYMLTADKLVPRQASVCVLFWRIVLNSILAALMVFGAVMLAAHALFLVGVLSVRHGFWTVAAFFLSLPALAILGSLIRDAHERRKTCESRRPLSVIGAMALGAAAAAKRTVCPIVEIRG